MSAAPVKTTPTARMCPSCGAPSDVLESRDAPSGAYRRRRRCPRLVCGALWSTIEIIRPSGGIPVAVDTRKAALLRDRLREILSDLDEVLGVEASDDAAEQVIS